MTKPLRAESCSFRIIATLEIIITFLSFTNCRTAFATIRDFNREVVSNFSLAESFAWDPRDNGPAVAFNDSGVLKYAKRGNGSWNITTVVQMSTQPLAFVSLAFNPISGYPAIAYSTPSLAIARFDGANWSTQTVDTKMASGGSLMFKPGTDIHAVSVIITTPTMSLMFAIHNGVSWSTTIVVADCPSVLVAVPPPPEILTSAKTSLSFDLGDSQPAIVADKCGGLICEPAPCPGPLPCPGGFTCNERIGLVRRMGTSWNTIPVAKGALGGNRSLGRSLTGRISTIAQNLANEVTYLELQADQWPISFSAPGSASSLGMDLQHGLQGIAYCANQGLKFASLYVDGWILDTIDSRQCADPDFRYNDTSGKVGIVYRVGNELNWAQFFAAPLIPTTPQGDVKIQGGMNGYVNPNRGETARIWITATGPGKVSVQIFTVNGNLVQQLEKNVIGNTPTLLEWVAKNSQSSTVASGVYLISIDGPGIRQTKKVVIIK